MSAARLRVDAHTDEVDELEASVPSRDMAKYIAMRPYFEVVAEGLKGSTGPISSICTPRMWWSSTSSPSRTTRGGSSDAKRWCAAAV